MPFFSSDSPRILIADDEQVIQQFYIKALPVRNADDSRTKMKQLEQELFNDKTKPRPALKPAGQLFDLTVCSSSSEAVEHVIRAKEENRNFSVVFLDIRMPPGPDGVWAAEQIRNIDEDVEIVIATAFSDIHPEDISFRVPPVHKLIYLQKPFHILEINHLASTLYAKWAMEKELKKTQSQLEHQISRQRNELAEAHKTLERIQKLDALGTVAGGIAHDFNNILSCINGHVELGILETDPESPLNKRLGNIKTACSRARDLAGRILIFSKQKEPEPIPVMPKDIITETLKLTDPSVPGTITIETDIRDTGAILADPTQLHQLLLNLITNALHAMGTDNGVLTIQLSETDRFPEAGNVKGIKLSVSDTGHGMSKETTDNIFDPYFTTKKQGEGTGLGLSVSHGIVKKHGGEITVQSAPGEGTRFDIYFKRIR